MDQRTQHMSTMQNQNVLTYSIPIPETGEATYFLDYNEIITEPLISENTPIITTETNPIPPTNNSQRSPSQIQSRPRNRQQRFVKILYKFTGRKTNQVDQITTKMLPRPDESPCSICLEDFNRKNHLVNTKCNHHYHYECLKKWLKNNKNCPICRNELNP